MEELPIEARALAGTMTTALRVPRPSSWKPSATLPIELWEARRELLQVNELLRWLHEHWNLGPARDASPPAGRGARSRVRQIAWRAVRPCLERYFLEEQDVLANLVRMVDVLAKRVDALAANQSRLLGAVRTDLVDVAGHLEELVAGIGSGA